MVKLGNNRIEYVNFMLFVSISTMQMWFLVEYGLLFLDHCC